jgi:hypothetical protein
MKSADNEGRRWWISEKQSHGASEGVLAENEQMGGERERRRFMSLREYM